MLINNVCRRGEIEILDFIKKYTDYQITFPYYAIANVCKYERINILEWIKNNPEYRLDSEIINLHYRTDKESILNWFTNNPSFDYIFKQPRQVPVQNGPNIFAYNYNMLRIMSGYGILEYKN